ncbi:MAG: hypothetical protein IT323_18535 [Anaerolineae bacterium]|nr:hypothetical protein [Anaerolineae bacterium]
MPEPLMRPQSAPLRLIALRLDVPELAAVAHQPQVTEAFRVTVQYHDARHPDQVATLVRDRSGEGARLSVAYRRATGRPLTLDFRIDAARFEAFRATMKRLGFDKLEDFEDIPWFGADLWLVERAAGSFHHDVIIPPDAATGVHAEIVALTRLHLREAVRAINP